MKNKNRKVWGIALAVLLALALGACGSAGETAGESADTVTNDGLTLSIPAEYADLLVVDALQDSEDGMLFTVSEKASIEAAEAMGEDADGAGWLFGIKRVSEDTLHQLLCFDLSGEQVFAGDDDGCYYLFCRPTDVRMIRENSEAMEADMAQWSALNEWASSAPETFLAENAGLTAERRGNSELEICLNRIAYMDDTDYTISSLEFGTMSPDGVDPAPYVEQLTGGVTYEYADVSETPDGEYVVLDFPEDHMRFDFFFMEGKQNYIRQVWGDENEALYLATFDDGETQAAQVMNDWYHAIAAASAPGAGGVDDLVGAWSEEIAGRGYIIIEKSEEAEDVYAVHITWGNSAFETYTWEMIATPSDDGASLVYRNGKQVILTFSEDGSETADVRYENGTGSFSLNNLGQLVWQDDMDHAGDGTVFIGEG